MYHFSTVLLCTSLFGYLAVFPSIFCDKKDTDDIAGDTENTHFFQASHYLGKLILCIHAAIVAYRIRNTTLLKYEYGDLVSNCFATVIQYFADEKVMKCV